MKKLETNSEKKSKSSLVVAKVIAVAVFCMVVLLLCSEMLAVAMYGIPLLLVEIAKVQGVGQGADWIIGCTLWFFPSLFMVLMLVAGHIALAKVCLKKLWTWVSGVLRKSV